MHGFDTANVIWLLVVLMLVGSSLVARRIPLHRGVAMLLAWIGIFAVALTIVSYRGEILAVTERMIADILGKSRQSVEGGTLRIAMGNDGHYWVDGTVNGVATRFLIDSGATITALSSTTARAAGLGV